jgi:hypothetical protein
VGFAEVASPCLCFIVSLRVRLWVEGCMGGCDCVTVVMGVSVMLGLVWIDALALVPSAVGLTVLGFRSDPETWLKLTDHFDCTIHLKRPFQLVCNNN